MIKSSERDALRELSPYLNILEDYYPPFVSGNDDVDMLERIEPDKVVVPAFHDRDLIVKRTQEAAKKVLEFREKNVLQRTAEFAKTAQQRERKHERKCQYPKRTDDELLEPLCDLLRKGRSIRQIALTLHVGPERLRLIRSHYLIVDKLWEKHVTPRYPRRKIEITPELLKRVEKAFLQGKTQEHMAAVLDVSDYWVYKLRKNHKSVEEAYQKGRERSKSHG